MRMCFFTWVVSSPALKQVSDECGWGEAEGWIPFDPWGGLEMDRVWRGSPPPTLEEWAEEGRAAAPATERIPVAFSRLDRPAATPPLCMVGGFTEGTAASGALPHGYIKGFAVVFKCTLQVGTDAAGVVAAFLD